MNRRITCGLTVVVIALLIAGAATAAKVKHPSKLEYPEITLKTPQYEEVILDNGMSGFIIEDHEIPVVEIYMMVSTSRPSAEKTGLNDLAAWTIRNGGTSDWPADRINEELEFVAAYVEFTGEDRYASIRVNCLKKDLDLCLTILGDLLRNPAFPEDKIELRRQTMLEDIRRENDDPRGIARREFAKVVYVDHPMAWDATEATVAAITSEDIAAYHQAFFRPNNTIFGVSGDVTRDEIIAALDEALEGWEPAPVTIESEPEMDLTFVPSINYVYKDMNQAVITIGHMGLNSHDENRVAVRIMNFILGGGSFTSRITQKVRSDEGLAYAAYSYYDDDPWNYGLFVSSSQTKCEASGRAISLILDIIREMRDEGPTNEEVEKAKDRYLNAHVFDYASKSAVVQRLVRLRWEDRPLDTPEKDFEIIAALSTDDVREVAAQYLHPDGLAILVVGDEEKLDQPLSVFGEVNHIELD
jgi:zinc protease